MTEAVEDRLGIAVGHPGPADDGRGIGEGKGRWASRHRAHDRYIEAARECVLRQEQALAYLAECGRPTARARNWLAALCRALDALQCRRRGEQQGGRERGGTLL